MMTSPALPQQHQFTSLDKLKMAARHESPEALKETAKLFEGQFIQMLFKSMRASSLGDEMFGSEQTKFYQDMYDKEIANTLAETGQLGFADMLIKQLGNHEQNDSVIETEASDGGLSVVKPSTAQVNSADKSKTVADKINEFVDDVWSAAKDAAKKLDIAPQVLVAQSALETGWGQHLGNNKDGDKSFNFFGIKADKGWNGDASNQQTKEFNGQFLQTVRDDFRAYSSAQESFTDYADFILNNPRYKDLPGSEPENYVQSLQDQGYATDPDYGNKLVSIMKNPHFQEKIATLELNK